MLWTHLLSVLPLIHGFKTPVLNVQDATQGRLEDAKVPVQLGVMSQCPDALLCESVFNEVLQYAGDKMDLSLVYIARPDDSEPTGIRCLHGPGECAGNVQQLCAAKYTPFKNWWSFVQCENFQGRSQIGLPETARLCAKAANIDWEDSGVGKCAGDNGEGEEGVQLLKESMILQLELGITKSCTVMLSGRKICVHDGDWKECPNGHTVKDFVDQVEEEYSRLNGF
ncbi:hypothetical protein BKA70DRAFT_559025 [Coprinopsis sp. MPI-PUGE-AT-0042]|nr:hypothetical protein BKA70DRAFT_559025 [Coprinopsis sp. MPI-PUGE-AT-0042]